IATRPAVGRRNSVVSAARWSLLRLHVNGPPIAVGGDSCVLNRAARIETKTAVRSVWRRTGRICLAHLILERIGEGHDSPKRISGSASATRSVAVNCLIRVSIRIASFNNPQSIPGSGRRPPPLCDRRGEWVGCAPPRWASNVATRQISVGSLVVHQIIGGRYGSI